jgi:hypothetical protein
MESSENDLHHDSDDIDVRCRGISRGKIGVFDGYTAAYRYSDDGAITSSSHERRRQNRASSHGCFFVADTIVKRQ